jgi:phosphatidylserine/phosphatidylglycerophosphate/cardiolipin synthase-like enzyme
VTAPIPLGVSGGRASLVFDEAYFARIQSLIAGAKRTCLCSLFIVDPSPLRDRHLIVDSLLRDLAGAHWRGIDVRLLIGGSRDNIDIAEASDLARARALQLGIPCRWATSRPIRGSHAKYVIVDDTILLGSHNWSPGAFTDQTQDSVVLESADLATFLTRLFDGQWVAAA